MSTSKAAKARAEAREWADGLLPKRETYTPAPWELCPHLGADADETCGCGTQGTIWGADDFIICEMGPRPELEGVRVAMPEAPREVVKANARLIASAPELLAAARATLLFHSYGQWTEERVAEWNRLLAQILGVEDSPATTKTLCDAARAAIAKAEGR